MYELINQLFQRLPPQLARVVAMNFLRYLPVKYHQNLNIKPIHALGLEFPHAVGLAAGYDATGSTTDTLFKFGFSFVEVGTVTRWPEQGCINPGWFAVKDAFALIYRSGYQNPGVDVVAENLSKRRDRGVVGVNIGLNEATSLSDAIEAYCYCYESLYNQASYVTIDLGSTDLQKAEALGSPQHVKTLLQALAKSRAKLQDSSLRHVPLLLKLSPDFSDEQIKRLTDEMLLASLDGVVATGSTFGRPRIVLKWSREAGQLSGRPLFSRARTVVELIHGLAGDSLDIIASGGIDSRYSAAKMVRAGAKLVQLYTGFLYFGPELIKESALEVAKVLEHHPLSESTSPLS